MRAGTWDQRPPTAGRTVLRVLTGLAVAAAVMLLVTVIWAADAEPVPDTGGTDIVRVGVIEGQSLRGYLDHSRQELDALRRAPAAVPGPPTWALVSLVAYLAPDRLPAVLGDAAVAEVYARAPLDGVRTAVVRIPVYRLPDDVVAGMRAAATRRDREGADYRRLGEQLAGGDVNVTRLRRAYETAARTAAAEAAAYRMNCACVFAAVVRADPAGLQRIADRPGVRAVDPAPEVRRLDRAEFLPPLPEEPDAEPAVARSATVPAPPGTSTVAPVGPRPLPSSSGAAVTSASPDRHGLGPGPSATASEEPTAVSSAPVPSSDPDVPSAAQGASRGASGR